MNQTELQPKPSSFLPPEFYSDQMFDAPDIAEFCVWVVEDMEISANEALGIVRDRCIFSDGPLLPPKKIHRLGHAWLLWLLVQSPSWPLLLLECPALHGYALASYLMDVDSVLARHEVALPYGGHSNDKEDTFMGLALRQYPPEVLDSRDIWSALPDDDLIVLRGETMASFLLDYQLPDVLCLLYPKNGSSH